MLNDKEMDIVKRIIAEAYVEMLTPDRVSHIEKGLSDQELGEEFERILKEMTPDSRIGEDIGFDSTAFLDMALALEATFGIDGDVINLLEIETVQDVFDLVAKNKAA